jgi:hypothetical protein
MDVIIMGVQHISKAAANGPQGVHSGKGSAAFEQKADKVLNIAGQQNAIARFVKSVKSRDESPFSKQLYCNMTTFRFTDNPSEGLSNGLITGTNFTNGSPII